MRHQKKHGMKLGTDASHTKAMKKSLVGALLANDRIKTTLPRAKAIRGDVDRIITWAKKGDLHSRRLAIAKVGDPQLVREIFEKVECQVHNQNFNDTVPITLVVACAAKPAYGILHFCRPQHNSRRRHSHCCSTFR